MKSEKHIGPAEVGVYPIGTHSANDAHPGTLLATPISKQSHSTSFGGRQKRYLVHRFAELRWFDPIGHEHVAFADDLSYRAWLKHRFDPNVLALNPAPKPVAYRRLGNKFTATPLLAWQTHAGRKCSLWLDMEWPVERRQRYEHFSITHDIDVVLISREQLTKDEKLLDNLDFGRQLLTIAINAGADLTQICAAVLSQLKRQRDCTRAELGGSLDSRALARSLEHLDAALFRLHANGSLRLDLKDRPYGDQTRIALN